MPRLRKTTTTNKNSNTEPFWLIGLYQRLSKEDLEKQLKQIEQSRSIDHQNLILDDFVKEYFEPGSYRIIKTFVDDGVTGTDVNRPDFQEMTQYILNKRMNCVVFKSLSRAFRNLADQSKFLEEFCPLHNIRVINAGEPFIDTYKRPRSASNMEVPIHGLMNERFAESTSLEVRKVFNVKRKNGDFIGSFTPYGYAKNPENKSNFIVDEDAAQVVRSIFRWFVYDGVSKRGIAQRLNEQGVPNPTAYKQKKGMKYKNPQSKVNDGLWSASSVTRILKNEMYIGNMVQGKFRIISYKVHTQVSVPEEEWYVVPNTHEAIVAAETFAKAQEMNLRDTRTPPGNKQVYLLSGFLRCPDCKKALHRRTSRGIPYYYCRSYSDKKVCTKHSIREDTLLMVVLKAIQKQIEFIGSLSQEIEQVNNAPVTRRQSTHLIHSLKTAEKDLLNQNDIADGLYLDWKSGDITKGEYHRLKSKLANQIERLEQVVNYLEQEIQATAPDFEADDPYLISFLQHRNIQELNRGILVELIDTIWVHEAGEITIDFKFADQYKHVVHCPENKGGNLVLVASSKAI